AGTSTPTSTSPFQLCQTPNQVFSSDNSTEFVQDGCAKSSAGSVTYTGQVETIDLKCNENGTFVIHMTTLAEDPAFGTTTLDAFSAAIPTTTQDATITCEGITPPTATDTATATNTAQVTSTNTPQ